jgi:hypothetical protein
MALSLAFTEEQSDVNRKMGGKKSKADKSKADYI